MVRVRSHASRLLLATGIVAALALALVPDARATHPFAWSTDQKVALVHGRLGATCGLEDYTRTLARLAATERPNDPRTLAALAATEGLALAWGDAPASLDEILATAERARRLDRSGSPEVELAQGIAALASASRTVDAEIRGRALDAADRDLAAVASCGTASAAVRFDAAVARFAVAAEREDVAALERALADVRRVARENAIGAVVLHPFRELAIDRLFELGAFAAASREAAELETEPDLVHKQGLSLELIRARSDLALGRPQDAIRDLEDVDYAASGGLEAESWLALDRPASALACARRTRNMGGTCHADEELVGRALLACRRFDEARGAFERGIALGGARCPRCRGGVAYALVAEGAPTPVDRARAARLVALASEVDGDAPEVLLARASLARLAGARADANRLAARARLHLDPRDAAAVEVLANRLGRALSRERWSDAMALAAELLDRRPGDVRGLEGLARACVASRHPAALGALELLDDRLPQDPWVFVLRGEARLEAGRLVDARRDLGRGLALLRASGPRLALRGDAQRALAVVEARLAEIAGGR